MHANQTGPQMTVESAPEAGQVPIHILDSTYTGEAPRANLELVVTELFKAVDCALREEFDVARVCVQRAATFLRFEPQSLPSFNESPSIEDPAEGRSRSGLAPWQIRKVRTHIAENLGTTLSIGDLAALVRLSRFHFSRAFKDTFGDTPHQYVLRRRIEHAQGLMLTTTTALAEIALECGLVDQAHLGRSFRRIVGETPAAWRRARMTGDQFRMAVGNDGSPSRTTSPGQSCPMIRSGIDIPHSVASRRSASTISKLPPASLWSR